MVMIALSGRQGAENVCKTGASDLQQFVAHAYSGHLQFQHTAQVYGRADEHQIHRSAVYGFLELLDLLFAVAHSREYLAGLLVLLVGFFDGAYGVGIGRDNFPCPPAPGGNVTCTVAHFAVGQGGTVLDHQHALTLDRVAVLHGDGGNGIYDGGVGVEHIDIVLDHFDCVGGSAVFLVDDDHVSHSHIGLARVILQFVARPERVYDHDLQVRLVEGEVVVAAVPDNNVGLLLGLSQYCSIVYARVDDSAEVYIRLVLLALLNCRFVQVQVIIGCKALHGLLGQIAIGHGVAHGDDALARLTEDLDDLTRGLTLAGAGAYSTD